jgi:hypothetical protein
MGKKSHGHYAHVNGKPRNAVVRLTAEELREMSANVRTVRHTDGLTDYERRAALLKSRGVDIKQDKDV